MESKKEKLTRVAMKLFAKYGFHAVGIDRILAESGIAKMTLYNYFPSKDDLILEILAQRDRDIKQSLSAFVEQRPSGFARLKAVFLWHDEWFRSKDFRGCLFINASAEFHRQDSPVHQYSKAHKESIKSFLEVLYRPLRPERASDLAVQTVMLLDGAIVAAQINGNSDAALVAWAATRRIAGFRDASSLRCD